MEKKYHSTKKETVGGNTGTGTTDKSRLPSDDRKKEGKRHFLVVAAASRGARIFVKRALQQGHDVTALCRAKDDEDALKRMQSLVKETKLTAGGPPVSAQEGTLRASSRDITNPITFRDMLDGDPSIDALCCFVGVTSVKQMMSRSFKLYLRTVTAMTNGMRESRWVETFYHRSVGAAGVPGTSRMGWPQNYNLLFKFYSFVLVPIFFPVYQDVVNSENVLGAAAKEGLKFVIFRPGALNDKAAERHVGCSFDETSLDEGPVELRHADVSISREDVAEQILRVASAAEHEREKWHGHGVYMVNMMPDYRGEMIKWSSGK